MRQVCHGWFEATRLGCHQEQEGQGRRELLRVVPGSGGWVGAVTAPHAFSSREDAEGWLAAERRLVECGTRIRRSIAPRSRSMTTPMEARRLGVSVRKNRSKTFSPCPSCIRMTRPGRGR